MHLEYRFQQSATQLPSPSYRLCLSNHMDIAAEGLQPSGLLRETARRSGKANDAKYCEKNHFKTSKTYNDGSASGKSILLSVARRLS